MPLGAGRAYDLGVTEDAEVSLAESFPPIADYGFLSDCENNCLVAPDGSIEWLCLPRPDSPSVFGAILDRTAGNFRFAPMNTKVPHQRRYIPGTMVLETTWHTPSGWLLVQDLLVVQPVEDGARRADYRRSPGDVAASGTLLRLATCIEGNVEVVINAVPVFEYGAQTGMWAYEGDGYEVMTGRPPVGDPVLTMTSSHPPRSGGRPLLRPLDTGEGRECLCLAVVVRWPTHRPGGGPGAIGGDGELLEGMALQRHVPRPSVAGLHGAQRTDAQGPELRPQRRHHGGLHHVAARDPRWGTQLGLSLHLDPRLLVHAAVAVPARLRLGGAGVLRLRARGGGRGRRRLQPADHVRHRRSQGSQRVHPRPSFGLAELPARTGRQRSVGPAPERRLGDAPRCRRHPPP